MKLQERTAIYSITALSKLIGIKIHKQDQGIIINIQGIEIYIPNTATYTETKRLIEKELIKYTFHNSLTPYHYQKKLSTNLTSKTSKSDKIVKQEPLLDLCY